MIVLCAKFLKVCVLMTLEMSKLWWSRYRLAFDEGLARFILQRDMVNGSHILERLGRW